MQVAVYAQEVCRHPSVFEQSVENVDSTGTVLPPRRRRLPLRTVEHSGSFGTKVACPDCKAGAFIVGQYTNRPGKEWHAWVHDVYPAPRIIEVPEELPYEIPGTLERSFSLYWRDPQSCAAALRTALERVADHLGAPKQRGNGWRLGLSDRLKAIKDDHPSFFLVADAIKNMGNNGAHGDPVTRIKLLDAYELLEEALRRLIADRRSAALLSDLKSNGSP